MTKYIIDATNGTILNMNDCYIVDAELLGDDIMLSDREAQEIANEHGISVAKMARDTGFGDNAYRYTVSYSPLSIKDEIDAWIDGGIYTEEDAEYRALMWAKNTTIENLTLISDLCMSYDSMWDGFRDNMIDSLKAIYEEVNKEGK